MWQFTPYTVPLAVATAIGLVSTVLVWLQRDHPSDVWATASQLSLSAWAGAHLVTLSVEPLALKLVGFAGIQTAMAATVATVFGFTVYFTGRGDRLTGPRTVGIVSFPILVGLLTLTNPVHEFVLVSPAVETAGSFAELTYGRGPGYIAFLAAYGTIALGYCGMLVQKSYRTRNVYRKQSILLFLSTFILTGLAVPSGLGLSPYPHFVLLPLGYLLIGLALIALTVSIRFVTVLPFDRLTTWWKSQFGDLVLLGRDFVMETIDYGIVIMDADGRIVDMNRTAKRMIGTRRPVGQHLREVSRVDRIIDGGPLFEMLRGERELDVVSDEIWGDTENGERCYDVTITQIEDRDDDAVGYAMLLVDITDRKRREQELEQRERALERRTADLEAQTTKLELQNERLDEFVGIVSHDLRNPLTVASGQTHLILDRLADGEQIDPDEVRTVDEAHERMESIIEDALELARQGKPITDPEPVDVADVARAAWDNVKTADATLELGAERSIRADRGRLLTVFENLFRNGVEHAGADATVRVGDLQSSEGFFVEDDGPGIPQDERANVLQHGFTTNDGGTGLGLAIVSDAARAHGWPMTVTESDDGGARFEFETGDEPATATPEESSGVTPEQDSPVTEHSADGGTPGQPPNGATGDQP